MAITLHLTPELEAGLVAEALAAGTTPEAWLRRLVESNLSAEFADSGPSAGTGMVWEDGLLVYRTGKPLATPVARDLVGRSREDRARRILGDFS